MKCQGFVAYPVLSVLTCGRVRPPTEVMIDFISILSHEK